MTTVAQNFGTMEVPAFPPKESLAIPFQSKDSVAYFYCSKCGRLRELNREEAEKALRLVNLVRDVPATLDQVDRKKNYILAESCAEGCGKIDDFAPFSLQEISA